MVNPKKRRVPARPISEKRRWKLAISAFVLIIVISALYLNYNAVHPQRDRQTKNKALMIDQLGLYYPNPNLISRTNATLTLKGFQVDIYEGSQVTVSLLNNLHWDDYRIIIFRTHSSTAQSRQGTPLGYTAIFTAEPYSDKYTYEQLTDQLAVATPSTLGAPDSQYYFAITPQFVMHTIGARLDGAIVLLMGCQGLATPPLSDSFTAEGAPLFVSWDGLVTIPQIDNGMSALVGQIATKGTLDGSGVQEVALQIGPDSTTGSELKWLSK